MKIQELEEKKKWDYENGYYWFSDITRINKMIAHYELYKMIKDIPGDIFELGVYKGISLIRFATFRKTLENDYSRNIVAFDAFGKFPTKHINGSDDLKFIKKFEEVGGEGISSKNMENIINYKNFSNITLIPGDVIKTIPNYIKNNPQTRLSLLHLDLDVKEPTVMALEFLFDRVVKGGLIVIDDYNTVSGATEAIDEFIAKNKLKLNKLPFYKIPSFIVKE